MKTIAAHCLLAIVLGSHAFIHDPHIPCLLGDSSCDHAADEFQVPAEVPTFPDDETDFLKAAFSDQRAGSDFLEGTVLDSVAVKMATRLGADVMITRMRNCNTIYEEAIKDEKDAYDRAKKKHDDAKKALDNLKKSNVEFAPVALPKLIGGKCGMLWKDPNYLKIKNAVAAAQKAYNEALAAFKKAEKILRDEEKRRGAERKICLEKTKEDYLKEWRDATDKVCGTDSQTERIRLRKEAKHALHMYTVRGGTEQEVRDDIEASLRRARNEVARDQRELAELPTGSNCDSAGQEEVDQATKAAKDAKKALEEATVADVHFSAVPLDKMNGKECSVMWNQRSYLDAKKRLKDATEAHKKAAKWLEKALVAAHKLKKQCRCDVKEKHEKKWKLSTQEDVLKKRKASFTTASYRKCALLDLTCFHCPIEIPTLKKVVLHKKITSEDC